MMIRPRHPLRGHGRMRLPPGCTAGLSAQKPLNTRCRTLYSLSSRYSRISRNTVAVPQVRDARIFFGRSVFRPSAAGVVAVFPLFTYCAAIQSTGRDCPTGTICFRAVAVTVFYAADHPACGVASLRNFRPVSAGGLQQPGSISSLICGACHQTAPSGSAAVAAIESHSPSP